MAYELLQEFEGVDGTICIAANHIEQRLVIECRSNADHALVNVEMEYGTAFLLGNFIKTILPNLNLKWRTGSTTTILEDTMRRLDKENQHD